MTLQRKDIQDYTQAQKDLRLAQEKLMATYHQHREEIFNDIKEYVESKYDIDILMMPKSRTCFYATADAILKELMMSEAEK
jgi:hypothetical protein